MSNESMRCEKQILWTGCAEHHVMMEIYAVSSNAFILRSQSRWFVDTNIRELDQRKLYFKQLFIVIVFECEVNGLHICVLH